MSHVHRVHLSDRIFFVTVNLRRALAPLSEAQYAPVAAAIETSRRKLGPLFLGYVLMPDHWYALILPVFALTISRAIQDVKRISARSLNRARHAAGPLWQHAENQHGAAAAEWVANQERQRVARSEASPWG